MRRTRIRERGLPLELVVISDLTQALSEQELQAWQRLVRVLGHELNNSLTPIKSIAGSLESIAGARGAAGRLARRYAARPGRHHRAFARASAGSSAPMRGWPSCPARSCSRWRSAPLVRRAVSFETRVPVEWSRGRR